jgi:glucosamine-6-phosphate deaminase
MEVVLLETADKVAAVAADAIEALVRDRPDAVLGLATGSSPLPLYRELIRRGRADDAPATVPSYAGVTIFLLDEYVGLPAGHAQTYLATIHREVTDELGIPRSQVHGPDPDPDGLPDAGRRYEEALASRGGVDLQVLGIGGDGHLAFNEPGSSLASLTRIKTLSRLTRAENARFFGLSEEVPRHVLTQGLGTILRARHLVLIATGAGKADAVARAIEGPVSASCPASVLQLHARASVLLDGDAAAGLRRADHYREVYAGKPAWQGL